MPTALFMVMVLFFLVTAVAYQTRENLRYTRIDAERTQRYFMARAAVHEALATQRLDPYWRSLHGPENPQVWTLSEATLKAWAEPHPGGPPSAFLIRGVAHPPGLPAQSATFAAVLMENSGQEPVLYARAGRSLSCFRQGQEAWTPLPHPPQKYFKS